MNFDHSVAFIQQCCIFHGFWIDYVSWHTRLGIFGMYTLILLYMVMWFYCQTGMLLFIFVSKLDNDVSSHHLHHHPWVFSALEWHACLEPVLCGLGLCTYLASFCIICNWSGVVSFSAVMMGPKKHKGKRCNQEGDSCVKPGSGGAHLKVVVKSMSRICTCGFHCWDGSLLFDGSARACFTLV